MRNFVCFIMVLTLVLPAFAAWMPHGAMHALHDNHMALHNSGHHEHHAHDSHEQVESHHPHYIDFASFFNDYLHVDLKKPDPVAFDLLSPDTQGFEYPSEFVVFSQQAILTIPHSRAPPDYLKPYSSLTPVYLSTQRLRI